MAKTTITKSATAKGDIGAIYDILLKTLTDLNYKETSTVWPTDIEFKRGKSGLLAKSIKDIKTVLKISLIQASDNVNIFFEYNFGVPSAYINEDSTEFEQEFMKIKHQLSGTATKEQKLCDVCLTPIQKGENFCRNCGRSAHRQKAEIIEKTSGSQDVIFDPNKVSFGYKYLDDSLYGGIPKNSVVLVTSPACEEKDLIVTRFIETGLDESGIVVYVTSDNKMVQNEKVVKSQEFYQVICNAQDEVRRPSDDSAIKRIKIGGVERINELSVALTTLLNNISKNRDNDEKPKRLVVDILSDMLLSNQSVNTRKWFRETITKFKRHNFTTLAILNPYMHSKEETHALLDLFDGQIDLYEKEFQGNSRTCMRVKRMSNNRYSSKEIVLIKENLWI